MKARTSAQGQGRKWFEATESLTHLDITICPAGVHPQCTPFLNRSRGSGWVTLGTPAVLSTSPALEGEPGSGIGALRESPRVTCRSPVRRTAWHRTGQGSGQGLGSQTLTLTWARDTAERLERAV